MGSCSDTSCNSKCHCCFDGLQSLVLLAMRLFWGYGFFQSGWGKLHNVSSTSEFFTSLGIPLATFNVYLVGVIEMIGGILLILGLFSRIAVIPLIVVMVTAYFTAHSASVSHLLTDSNEVTQQAPFNYLLTCIIIFAFGAGRISIDYILKRCCCKSGCKNPNHP